MKIREHSKYHNRKANEAKRLFKLTKKGKHFRDWFEWTLFASAWRRLYRAGCAPGTDRKPKLRPVAKRRAFRGQHFHNFANIYFSTEN